MSHEPCPAPPSGSCRRFPKRPCSQPSMRWSRQWAPWRRRYAWRAGRPGRRCRVGGCPPRCAPHARHLITHLLTTLPPIRPASPLSPVCSSGRLGCRSLLGRPGPHRSGAGRVVVRGFSGAAAPAAGAAAGHRRPAAVDGRRAASGWGRCSAGRRRRCGSRHRCRRHIPCRAGGDAGRRRLCTSCDRSGERQAGRVAKRSSLREASGTALSACPISVLCFPCCHRRCGCRCCRQMWSKRCAHLPSLWPKPLRRCSNSACRSGHA